MDPHFCLPIRERHFHPVPRTRTFWGSWNAFLNPRPKSANRVCIGLFPKFSTQIVLSTVAAARVMKKIERISVYLEHYVHTVVAGISFQSLLSEEHQLDIPGEGLNDRFKRARFDKAMVSISTQPQLPFRKINTSEVAHRSCAQQLIYGRQRPYNN